MIDMGYGHFSRGDGAGLGYAFVTGYKGDGMGCGRWGGKGLGNLPASIAYWSQNEGNGDGAGDGYSFVLSIVRTTIPGAPDGQTTTNLLAFFGGTP